MRILGFSTCSAALVVMLTMAAHATPLSPDLQKIVRDNITAGCLKKVTTDPKALADEKLYPGQQKKVCECTGERYAATATMEDLTRMNQLDMASKALAQNAACVNALHGG